MSMKIKTSELTGWQLNAAVAMAMGGRAPHEDGCGTYWTVLDGQDRALNSTWAQRFRPSEEWQYGGPIIERERIEIRFDRSGRSTHAWYASTLERMLGGDTPLIAAMRCFVASKLGDEVEIPERAA